MYQAGTNQRFLFILSMRNCILCCIKFQDHLEDHSGTRPKRQVRGCGPECNIRINKYCCKTTVEDEDVCCDITGNRLHPRKLYPLPRRMILCLYN